jgi:hypothetical protein
MEEDKSQPTARHKADDRTFNQGKVCPPQATIAALKPWRATVHRRGTHDPDSALEPRSVPGGHWQETAPE